MTKATKRARKGPSELDGKIAAIRKAARALDRLRTRALAAQTAADAAQIAYEQACAAVAEHATTGGEAP